jgi:hypothetical protein
MTSLGGVSVLSVMTTPDKAYRWWYRDPLTKILFKGTFAKIGVKNLRWINYASVTAKTPRSAPGCSSGPSRPSRRCDRSVPALAGAATAC